MKDEEVPMFSPTASPSFESFKNYHFQFWIRKVGPSWFYVFDSNATTNNQAEQFNQQLKDDMRTPNPQIIVLLSHLNEFYCKPTVKSKSLLKGISSELLCRKKI